jgi:hypothetical protein
MKSSIQAWYDNMVPRVEQFAQHLDKPILSLLATIAANIDASKADPALKLRALEALEDAQRRIATARDTLLTDLEDSLRETRIHFTTEIDISCPVATVMKPVYELATTLSGAGIMERQRQSIANSTTSNEEDPKAKVLCSLAKKIEGKLVKEQKKAWNTTCGVFIGEVIRHIDDFSLITEHLLIDNAYMTDEHRRARIELKGLLKEFDAALKAVQRRFTGEAEEQESPEKKIKLEEVEEGVMPEEDGQGGVETTLSTSDAEVPGAVPIQLAPGWFRATFAGLG